MNYFTYDIIGNESLTIEFICDKCGSDVLCEEIEIPYPDFTAETSRESRSDAEYEIVCDSCEKEFVISLSSSIYGGDGSIDDLPEEHEIEVTENPEPYYEEQYRAISSNTLFLQTFKSEMESLKELNEIELDNPSTDKTLRRQIYIGIIASMETYLSDAFINTTLNSKEFTKRFVETFHDFKAKPISLNELFDYHERIETICKQAMLDVIYHNLSKVKGMYKDTIDIDVGDISIPFKAVMTRHDLVHRNGKTKEGNEVDIDKDIIEKLIGHIEAFIENIDTQIKAKAVIYL